MQTIAQLEPLGTDETGVTAVEFGFIAPVFMLLLLATFDLGHQMYATAIVQGALQEAARGSTLENGLAQSTNINAKLTASIRNVVPNANVVITRRNYANFQGVRSPEEWTDGNNDGVCNDGEFFEDLNFNGRWDRDRGRDGMGGARDAVLLTASVTYNRMFGAAGLTPIGRQVTIKGVTVLRNQPYDDQNARAPVPGSCT